MGEERKTWRKALRIVFFPITGVVWLCRLIARRVKLSITVKTTLIFTLLFGLVLAGYVIFIISSIEHQLTGQTIESTEQYLTRLKWTSLILVALFLMVGAVVGGIASTAMISPLRKMINTIDSIDADNLDKRLEPVDSRDELLELTDRFNAMLNDIQMTLERQSNFISDASHELKTPLSVIQGYANMLDRWGKDDPAILAEGIETIRREADNMKRIVQQLLLLAKLGNFAMTKTRFTLSEAVQEAVDAYRVMNLPHEITFAGEKDIFVETDKSLLIESVRTLIDNAVKYTPGETGRIAVRCVRAAGGAEITVTDNGIGISAEDLPRVFDRFYRCDKARGRESGSSGLGLTIAKNIIEIMGGDISVTSVVGQGTTFKIRLY